MTFETLPLDTLRTRHGNKWNRFDEDVLPAWVADMDFPLAPPLRECIASALALGTRTGDCAYRAMLRIKNRIFLLMLLLIQ